MPTSALPTTLLTAINECTSPKQVLVLVEAADLSAADLGHALYTTHSIVATGLLGSLLGDHHPYWQQLAIEYPKHFQNRWSAGVGIVEAIRDYLWRFRLPGESAQIERIIQGFAAAYFFATGKGGGGGGATVASSCKPPLPKSICPEAVGWYVEQTTTTKGAVCCVHCGALDTLQACTGCDIIQFCRKCRYTASSRGHAVVGSCGYGRACVAARAKQGHGVFVTGDKQLIGRITYATSFGTEAETTDVAQPETAWNDKCSTPFVDEDAVFVLSYSIIMLTTNLHNVNVKEKMQKHEFLQQNRQINGGGNFAGDFLCRVYDEVGVKAVEVMRE
jgi:hypothetical protein